MAFIEIRGLPTMPYISASSGMIEQLLYDENSGICTGVYIAGLNPGVVILKASIDGNIVATGEILLESAKWDISKISLRSLSDRVIVGKTVHITGMITPPLVSASIELEVLTPANLSWLEKTQTRDGGTFDFHIPLNEPGTWRFCSFLGRVSSSVLVVHAEAQPYIGQVGSRWRTYTNNDGLADNQVEFMLEDRYGNLWAGTANGISKLEGETWINYGLEGEHIKYLLEDSNGFLWAGMWGGGVARLEGSTWVIYTIADGLSSDYVTFMIEDSRGILWIGTWDGGLSKLENGLWKTYTTDNGLGYNQISSLMEDSRGNLWVGTWGEG